MRVLQQMARRALVDAVTEALETARGHNRFRGKLVQLPAGLLFEFQARGAATQPLACLARWNGSGLRTHLPDGSTLSVAEPTEAARFVADLLAAYTRPLFIETHDQRTSYK